jgi:hypothetical protein
MGPTTTAVPRPSFLTPNRARRATETEAMTREAMTAAGFGFAD